MPIYAVAFNKKLYGVAYRRPKIEAAKQYIKSIA
jgi:hypothetical protein